MHLITNIMDNISTFRVRVGEREHVMDGFTKRAGTKCPGYESRDLQLVLNHLIPRTNFPTCDASFIWVKQRNFST